MSSILGQFDKSNDYYCNYHKCLRFKILFNFDSFAICLRIVVNMTNCEDLDQTPEEAV